MQNQKLRSQIDKLWEQFWTGGITNPLTVIEQISFLMFARLLDIQESLSERKAQRTGKEWNRIFNAKQQSLRWSQFKQLPGAEMLEIVRDKVFAHFRNLAQTSRLGEYMKDAQLMVQKASLLVSAVNAVDALPLTEGDTKGDLYEYLLSKLTTAGINGQFRTPRHIIRLMVDLMEPKPTERICDPACGTAGFLVSVMEYLLEKHTSAKAIIIHEDGTKIFTGDLLEPYRNHIQSNMFHGFDFDTTMLRIAAMNLMLHGVSNPDIHYQDTLGNNFIEKYPAQAKDGFDLILANPPFKGSLDESDVESSLLAKVKTKKTELLFVALILRMLKLGGRAAVIVPDGVLFGSSNAHVSLRKLLIDENQLEGIIALPSGVFKPYAGVSTAIIIFSKGGNTENVFFYAVQNDGFSLDDKRMPIAGSDLPDARERWKAKNPDKDIDRKAKAFFVPVQEIKDNNYDLSIGRYKEVAHQQIEYELPKEILSRLIKLEDEIQQDLKELEGILK